MRCRRCASNGYQKILLALGLGLSVSACENFREDIAMGEWYEAGVAEAPPLLSPTHVAQITTLVPGSGRTVRAGDLVKLRAWTQHKYKEQAPTSSPPVDLWVWTGRLAEADSKEVPHYSWGWLGAASLRNGLIGRTQGERFALDVPARGSSEWAPKFGFAAASARAFTLVNRYNMSTLDYPDVTLAKDHQGKLTSEIEIVAACPAQLYRRVATLTQWGYVLNVMDGNFQSSRRGILRWSALEGECGPPDGKVRFEIGPIYFHRYDTPGRLFSWSDSYRRLRPPDKFPHEYVIRE